jgi:hypothetical protein
MWYTFNETLGSVVVFVAVGFYLQYENIISNEQRKLTNAPRTLNLLFPKTKHVYVNVKPKKLLY